MTVASWQFLAFSAAVAAAATCSSRQSWRALVLLVANVLFLATMSDRPMAYVPLLLFLVGGYTAVWISGRVRSGVVLAILLTATTTAFLWLKKYWFLSGLGFLQQAYVTVGLSYVFFRVMHLIIDARDDARMASIGVLSYVNYTLNFTSLIAGPIQRYGDFLEQLPPLDLAVAGRAVERIVIGLFKVSVLAAWLFEVQGHATLQWLYDRDRAGWLAPAFLALSVYPLYLYFNFSGYVDIVIGVARFIGYELPENFNRPFAATSFMDFWSRYHMTLSNWLRDYVFTPFLRVLMVRFPAPSLDPLLGAVAFFLTFFIIGVWHGPTLMFVFYGLMLGLGMSINKLFNAGLSRLWGRRRYREAAARAWYRWPSMGLTFAWYALSMMFFWADQARVERILRVSGVSRLAWLFVLIFIAAAVVLPVLDYCRSAALKLEWRGIPVCTSRYTRVAWATALAFACVLVSVIVDGPAPEIVYKAF